MGLIAMNLRLLSYFSNNIFGTKKVTILAGQNLPDKPDEYSD
jgi:hypothetical protein